MRDTKREKISDPSTRLKSNVTATSELFKKAVNSFWDIYGEARLEKIRPAASSNTSKNAIES